MIFIKAEFGAGTFDNLVSDAIALAKRLDIGLIMSFNGVQLTITGNKTIYMLRQDYEDGLIAIMGKELP